MTRPPRIEIRALYQRIMTLNTRSACDDPSRPPAFEVRHLKGVDVNLTFTIIVPTRKARTCLLTRQLLIPINEVSSGGMKLIYNHKKPSPRPALAVSLE
ncbi:hypothetical protein AVEN_61603-1 [Araneus ventricosus]|uniref:Uncharacterized protein n=1 Tax=Araneus ventricosus TaxID=182803 RepID=A0A4Y2NPV8_ARAVE|nr:hypothetical protein AVEN_61603-1 [Araneus ventricosus]